MPTNHGQTDAELVALSLSDSRNFGTMIERYEDKFSTYIYRISGASKEDAKDILQEAFIKIYQNLSEFDSSLKFSSWAYRIVRNQTFDHFRKTKSRPQMIFDDENNTLFERIVSSTDLPTELDKKITYEKIRYGLKQLDAKYQEALELFFLEEKTYEEISDILHYPTSTVGTLISRAKKKLKIILEKYDEFKQ